MKGEVVVVVANWKVLKPKRPITDKHIHTEVVQGRRMVTKLKGTQSLLMNFKALF